MSRAFLRPSLSPKRLHQSSSIHCPPANKASTNNENCHERIIQVWNTPCIVTNFGKKRLLPHFSSSSSSPKSSAMMDAGESAQKNSVVLINPGNPNLSGVRDFPYFPKGGPVPKKQPNVQAHHIMGYVSQWGGMDVGSGMLFPASVVDGLVHQLGGSKLQYECQFHRYTKGEERACPVGQAVATSSGGVSSKLHEEYDGIIHTTPPFYLHGGEEEDVVDGLKRCYRNSFQLAFSGGQRTDSGDGSILDTLFSSFSSLFQRGIGKQESGEQNKLVIAAVPLLGAGARGFPLDLALDVAASEAAKWRCNKNMKERGSENGDDSDEASVCERDIRQRLVIAFGVPDPEIANMLVQKIELQ